MARTKDLRNGALEQALATLIQNQASFVAQKAETDRYLAEMQRLNTERFQRIEAILLDHSRILAEHTKTLQELSEVLQALPDAVREKFGFRPPEPR